MQALTEEAAELEEAPGLAARAADLIQKLQSEEEVSALVAGPPGLCTGKPGRCWVVA